MMDISLLPLKAQYDDIGYVIVTGLVNESDRPDLEKACEHTVTRTREGAWPHRRTIGKQFPPYGDDHPDSWGVQHLMHPELGEPAFVRWYTSDKFIVVVQELLGCQEEDLQMELLNLLINPLSHDFALRWHRDDIREKATENEERKALSIWHYGVQWNTALYDDSCLYVVPRSHRVPRTREQRQQSEGQAPPKDPLEMPGAIQVNLKAGETVFYNSNILHCATYDSKKKRATMHGCIGNVKGGSSRARNILQHNLEWMRGDKFREGLPNERSKRMLERLLETQKGQLLTAEYSLEG